METALLPLPLYETKSIGFLTSKDGERFEMLAGLDKALVEQLKQRSLNPHDKELQAYTSDKKRFGEGSYEEWYTKQRTPFALIDAGRNLAALVWFGPKPLGRKSLKYLSQEEMRHEYDKSETDWHTMVYRSYPPYRGKGLMAPFLKRAMKTYCAAYPKAKLWVGVSTNNHASIALATKLGLNMREDLLDKPAHWCAMTLEKPA